MVFSERRTMVNAKSMKTLSLASVLTLLMIGVALVPSAVSLSPSANRAKPSFVLEKLVPASFLGWRVLSDGGAQVVNPQAQEELDKLYSQLFTRTYISEDGYRIMLSIAYGNEQRGDLELHRPDVCYPAQGFTITAQRRSAISTGGGKVNVERLEAQQGTRVEPITYWVRIGEQNIIGISLFGRRLEDLRFALKGHVPDGLLFRVSSIDEQRERAFARQDKFVSDLLSAVGPSGRMKLAGTR
jgi:EpsI family protein